MSDRRPERNWFEKADQDLELARRALGPGKPLPAMACFHAQQCAEKYLKGYLIAHSVPFRFVHDLVLSYAALHGTRTGLCETDVGCRSIRRIWDDSALSDGRLRRARYGSCQGGHPAGRKSCCFSREELDEKKINLTPRCAIPYLWTYRGPPFL